MKIFLRFALLFFSFNNLSAQDIIVNPNPIIEWETLGNSEILGQAIIRNDSNEEKTYVWERTILCENGINQTWFCDPSACYIPDVIDGQFTLFPGAEGPFEFHATFSAPANNMILAQIKIYESDSEENILEVNYEFNSSECTVSTENEALKNINLFPNPTKDHFTLTNIQNVKHLIIYNNIGTPLKQYTAEEEGNYNIRYLPPGIYTIQLLNKKGNNIGIKRLSKQ